MSEEEYFRTNFPDSCYGDKPLSPHWDYFQFGVEFGERQSEENITELEAQIEKMRDCLNRWYIQKSDKFTDSFYEQLIKDTEECLWSDAK